MAETCWLSLYPHLCLLAVCLRAVGMCHFTVIMLSLTQSDRAASTPAFSFSLQSGGEGHPSQEHFKPLLSSLALSFLLIFKLVCFSNFCHHVEGLGTGTALVQSRRMLFTADVNIRLAIDQCSCDLCPLTL